MPTSLPALRTVLPGGANEGMGLTVLIPLELPPLLFFEIAGEHAIAGDCSGAAP